MDKYISIEGCWRLCGSWKNAPEEVVQGFHDKMSLSKKHPEWRYKEAIVILIGNWSGKCHRRLSCQLILSMTQWESKSALWRSTTGLTMVFRSLLHGTDIMCWNKVSLSAYLGAQHIKNTDLSSPSPYPFAFNVGPTVATKTFRVTLFIRYSLRRLLS